MNENKQITNKSKMNFFYSVKKLWARGAEVSYNSQKIIFMRHRCDNYINNYRYWNVKVIWIQRSVYILRWKRKRLTKSSNDEADAEEHGFEVQDHFSWFRGELLRCAATFYPEVHVQSRAKAFLVLESGIFQKKWKLTKLIRTHVYASISNRWKEREERRRRKE